MGGRAMPEFAVVTEDDLARARRDPAYRQQLLAQNLDLLLAALNKLRRANAAPGSANAGQIREGVQLAVRLADILHKLAEQISGPRAA
jgi:hypothetical protein